MLVGEDEQGVMGQAGGMWRTNEGSAARFYVISCEHVLPAGTRYQNRSHEAQDKKGIEGARLHVKCVHETYSPFEKIIRFLAISVASQESNYRLGCRCENVNEDVWSFPALKNRPYDETALAISE